MAEMDDVKENIQDKQSWLKGFFLLVFIVIAEVSKWVAFCLVVFQFIHVLLTRKPNKHLQDFGASLSQYIYQMMQYLTFNSEAKPFPFAEWPKP
jgi:hypothetical protein